MSSPSELESPNECTEAFEDVINHDGESNVCDAIVSQLPTNTASVPIPVANHSEPPPPPHVPSLFDAETASEFAQALMTGFAYTFSVYPEEGARIFPTLEDAALNEPLRGTFVMGFVCVIQIYEGIDRRKPLFNILAHLVPCEHLSLHSQRQGDYEITNVSHHLHLWLGRLRPLLLVVTLP
jgi:hypothetical protein